MRRLPYDGLTKRRRTSRLLGWVIAIVLHGWSASAVVGQEAADTLWLDGVGLLADVSDAGVDVTVTFNLRGTPAAGGVGLRWILHGQRRLVEASSLDSTGGIQPLEIDRTLPRVSSARVRWGPGEGELRVRYRLEPTAADATDLVIPVPIIDALPSGSAERFFESVVSLPEGMAVWEAFPRSQNRAASESSPGSVEMDLPVVPSLLRLRGGVGDAPVLTVPAIVDLAVLIIILGLSVIALFLATGSGRKKGAVGGESS